MPQALACGKKIEQIGFSQNNKIHNKIIIMKKIFLFCTVIYLVAAPAFSQIKFSDETKKYIEYNDRVTVFKNGLLIDGKGNAAKPHQTVIISNVKLIGWVMMQKPSIPKMLTLLI